MKILVIGDSCTDVFIYGKVDKLCPDAPVPVLVPVRRSETGGMAANVYENIRSLDVSVDIITNKKKITKTRYVEEKTNHQIVRVDSEQKKIPRVRGLSKIDFRKYQVIVISDYNKGFLEYEDIEYVCANHASVFIDTKKRIDERMSMAAYIKINEPEYIYNINSGQDLKSFEDKLIVTMGSKGCKYRNRTYSVKKVEIKDNSGAGDTFISGLAVKYAKTGDIQRAIIFANKCATEVVQHRGVTKIGTVLKFK